MPRSWARPYRPSLMSERHTRQRREMHMAGRRVVGGRRISAIVGAILALLTAAAASPASAQAGGLGVGVTPAFDSPVTVGEQDQPALIQFTNNSFGQGAL